MFHQTTGVINFDTKSLFNSTHYLEFIEKYPNLKGDLRDLIADFVNWAKKPYGDEDICFPQCASEFWSKNGQFNHWNYDSCSKHKGYSWNFFPSQIGTTRRKFSLTEYSTLSNSDLKLLATVLSKCGFSAIVASYSVQGNEYVSNFSRLEENTVVEDNDQDNKKFVHICIAL